MTTGMEATAGRVALSVLQKVAGGSIERWRLESLNERLRPFRSSNSAADVIEELSASH